MTAPVPEKIPPAADHQPAVEFLSALQPSDSAVRRRAFTALLRAVNSTQSGQRP